MTEVVLEALKIRTQELEEELYVAEELNKQLLEQQQRVRLQWTRWHRTFIDTAEANEGYVETITELYRQIDLLKGEIKDYERECGRDG